MGVTIALIQPIHGQGYNSDIPRPDAPVIYIGAFSILTARAGRRSIYKTPQLTGPFIPSIYCTVIFEGIDMRHYF